MQVQSSGSECFLLQGEPGGDITMLCDVTALGAGAVRCASGQVKKIFLEPNPMLMGLMVCHQKALFIGSADIMMVNVVGPPAPMAGENVKV